MDQHAAQDFAFRLIGCDNNMGMHGIFQRARNSWRHRAVYALKLTAQHIQ
jgi:hypothetical protein